MDLKKVRLVVVVLTVISLIFSVVVSFPKSMTSLSLVVDTIASSDGTIYLIDEQTDYCTIYHIDEDGNNLGYIKQDLMTTEYYYYLENMYLYGGNLYCIVYTNEIANSESAQRSLYICNFDNHSMEEVLQLENSNSMYSYYVKDDMLNLINYDYDEGIVDYSSSVQFESFTEDVVYNSFLEMSHLILDDNGNTFFTTIDNELYRVLDETTEERVYPIGENFGGVAEATYDGDNKIYFVDTNKNRLMYYDISKNMCREVNTEFYSKLAEYNSDNNTDYELSDLTRFNFSSEGYFTASVNTSGNVYDVLVYNADGVQVIDKVHRLLSTPMLILIMLVVFVATFVVLSIVVGAVYVLVKTYIPLIVRMVLVFLCLYGVVVGSLLCVVKPYLTQTFEDLTYDNALYVCQNKLNRLGTVTDEDVESILNTRYNGDWEYFSDVQDAIYSVVNAQKSFSEEWNEYSQDSSFLNILDFNATLEYMYSVYFINPDDDVIMVYNSDYTNIVPLAYQKTKYVSKVIQNVVATGEKQLTDDLYLMQYCNALYAPIFNESNEVVGVFEIDMINNSENLFLVNEMINTLVLQITIIVLVLIVIVSIMLNIFLNPLKDLKNKAIDLTSGNIGIKAKPKGNDEVTALAVQFNKVSQELEDKISEINALKGTYQYYIPSDVCNILKRLNISNVSVGDTTELPVAVVQIKISMENIDVENRTFVTTLNKFLENIVTLTTNHGGFIEHFDRHTIKVLYYKNYANAIRTAVSINEFVNTLSLTKSNFVPLVNISISFEDLNFTIIGNQDRMNFVTNSKYTLNMDELKSMYGSCSVVVTDKYIQKVPDFFEIFDSRFIGLSYIDGQPVKLFEVFNGNDLYNKNMKRIHKDNFETAVRLYLTKDFRTARNMFVDIFENYPKDVLSKNYIRLCDDLIS